MTYAKGKGSKLPLGGGLKTTGNARKSVSGKPASVKVPGLPGLSGKHEATGAAKQRKKSVKASVNAGSKY